MKVLLVNPAPTPNNKRLFCSPPLGLMYNASAIEQVGHEVEIADFYSFDLQVNFEPYDFIGITGMSFQHSSMLKLASEIKSLDNDKIVGFGGPHASVMAKLMLKNSDVDFVFRGEFEEQAHKFFKHVNDRSKWKTINGMCFRSGNRIHMSPSVFVEDIDKIPFPAWDLIDLKKYSSGHHGFFYVKNPVGSLLSSRGCSFPCTFCAAHAVSGRKWRCHSVERVLSEIDYLVNEKNIKELHIEDDNFCLSIPRAKEIMQGIIDNGYDLKIGFPNGIRIDLLDNGLLSLMHKAGVYCLTFGIETGSERIQQLTKKNLDLTFVKNQIKKVKKHGFLTQGFFILGFPYETEQDIKATIKYAKTLDLDAAFFGSFVPLPGSDDFDLLLENGEIDLTNINWDNFCSVKPFPSSNLSAEKIKSYVSSAYKQFYRRPRILCRNLRRIKSFRQFRMLTTRILEVVR